MVKILGESLEIACRLRPRGQYSVRRPRLFERAVVATAGLLALLANAAPAASQGEAAELEISSAYGLTSRPAAEPYLRMPRTAGGELPRLLSETGAFKDVRALVPADALIPYDLVVPFWSDRAAKHRWISVPTGATIRFSRTGEWIFPPGTVLVKHFDLPLDDARPEITRRLETRFIVVAETGGVYGVTYKWRADDSDAELMAAAGEHEDIAIRTAAGERLQSWYYPSREDCLKCHTPVAGFVLGPSTRQLNRAYAYPSGATANQLRTLNHIGLFDTRLPEDEFAQFPRLARSDDPSRSLEDRARSYLDANCAHCHRPGGTVANFDARFSTPLERQNLIGGPVLLDQGVDGARVIVPNDIWRSILYMRANTTESFKMPPLARNEIDEPGMALLREWIESMAGRPVLPPPEISPRGGSFDRPVRVSLKSEPGATIRFTLDGSAPGPSDPIYEGNITLTGPTILRARAFKEGHTESITTQEIFIVSE